MKSILSFLVLSLVVAACTSGNVSVGGDGDGGAADGSSDGAGPVDAALTDGAVECKETPISRLCVRGEAAGGASEALASGAKVTFQVSPKGCHSSSCTIVVDAGCVVEGEAGGVVTLSGSFCLGKGAYPECTPDCSGGGFRRCEASGLADGKYTAKLGDLEVPFEIPGTVPLGGTCVGGL